MRGILSKIFVELRWQWLGFSLALAVVMGLLTALLPKVLGDIHVLFDRLPFIRPLLTALLGVDPGLNLTSTMSQAFLWVHPTVLTIVWAHEVIYCTRMPAGESVRSRNDRMARLRIDHPCLRLPRASDRFGVPGARHETTRQGHCLCHVEFLGSLSGCGWIRFSGFIAERPSRKSHGSGLCRSTVVIFSQFCRPILGSPQAAG